MTLNKVGRSKAAKLRKNKLAVLVYQAGIANVFSVDTFDMSNVQVRNANRLLQSDFRGCEMFARGLDAAGVRVITAHCNMAGDIVNQPWRLQIDEAPFSDKFSPVYSKGMDTVRNY